MKILNILFIQLCLSVVFNVGRVSAQCSRPLNTTANISLKGVEGLGQTLSKGQIARRTFKEKEGIAKHTLDIVTTTGKVSIRVVGVVQGSTNSILLASCQTINVGGKSVTPIQIPSGLGELRYEIIAGDSNVTVDWSISLVPKK